MTDPLYIRLGYEAGHIHPLCGKRADEHEEVFGTHEILACPGQSSTGFLIFLASGFLAYKPAVLAGVEDPWCPWTA